MSTQRGGIVLYVYTVLYRRRLYSCRYSLSIPYMNGPAAGLESNREPERRRKEPSPFHSVSRRHISLQYRKAKGAVQAAASRAQLLF